MSRNLIPHDSFGLDGDQRIFADQAMEPIVYIHFQAELLAGPEGIWILSTSPASMPSTRTFAPLGMPSTFWKLV